MTRAHKFAILGLVSLATLALLLVLSPEPSPPDPPLPNPNGYLDFVKAGQSLVEHTNDARTLNHDDLRAYIRSNAEAFKLCRVGLSRESRVPIEYSFQYYEQHVLELTELKRLARALTAEGRLAELDARTNEAARIYLDVVRLGHESVRGGLLIDHLLGIACQSIGHRALQDVLSGLDAQMCRETIKALEHIDAKAETTDEVLRLERIWSRRTYGWQMLMLISSRTLKTKIEKSEQKLKDNQRQRRVLMLDLAARAYELEKGERPKRLTDLVPVYLKAIPQDPSTGTNLVYPP